MVAMLKTAIFMDVYLQMVVSLKLNVKIREVGTEGTGNTTAGNKLNFKKLYE